MAVHFYNTLTRRQEHFKPIVEGEVRMYTCGPTVYDYPHVGNYRAYLFEDLVRRYLKYCGFRVTQVMNLTDVDDKTIRGSRAAGLPLSRFTQKYIDAFFDDLDTLNIERAEYYPAATGHVPEMIALISRLMEKRHAYRAGDGSVYFSIASCPDYGRLARLDIGGLRAGARVSQDEYEKENVADFALWKAWDEEDGDVWWDSPWGRGRPGWHIECSAMSMKYLGESFDIHTGGIDNIFPHHVDEIAQSECATGKPYAHTWLHCAHLIVDGQKMAKSLGNFYTLRQVLDMGYSGREVRYELLGAHYRQSLNFTVKGLDSARAALQRIDNFMDRLQVSAGREPGALPDWAQSARERFQKALDDDLNFSGALASLFDLIHEGNRIMDQAPPAAETALALQALLAEFDTVFGFLRKPAETVDEEVRALVERRQEARSARRWQEADELREAIAAKGYRVEDTPQGPVIRRA